jgi:hypothetical protein
MATRTSNRSSTTSGRFARTQHTPAGRFGRPTPPKRHVGRRKPQKSSPANQAMSALTGLLGSSAKGKRRSGGGGRKRAGGMALLAGGLGLAMKNRGRLAGMMPGRSEQQPHDANTPPTPA